MKKIFAYLFINGLLILLIWIVVQKGSQIGHNTNGVSIHEIPSSVAFSENTKPVVIDNQEHILQQFKNNIKYPLSIFLIQVLLILGISRIFGIITKKLGQQSVIGEIIAGLFLGSSFLGWFFPNIYDFLFPQESLISLQFLSQIGLAFFMFVIGMDLDFTKTKNKAYDALLVSHICIAFSFLLGTILSFYIYDELAPKNTSFVSFTLFMGISMSITAFPVLARIIKERGLTRTPIGVFAITCAAADDITAWCLLATIIAVVKAGSIISALFTIGLAIMYIIFMLKIIKPWLQKISDKRINKEKINKNIVAISFFILLSSAYFTEIIGIHALFGAFIAGVIMPNNIKFKEVLTDKIEDVSTLLLLPIFFVYTGLRTQIGLLNESHLWTLSIIVILLAMLGKIGGGIITSKIIGKSWKDALTMGVFMNTRGLMELIVLNIGYDLGVFSSEIFTILVLMALFTTFLTGPLLNLIDYIYRKDTVSN